MIFILILILTLSYFNNIVLGQNNSTLNYTISQNHSNLDKNNKFSLSFSINENLIKRTKNTFTKDILKGYSPIMIIHLFFM